MDIKQTMLEHHQMMIDKGFHKQPIELGTLLMLIVSECSEALEAKRKPQNTSINHFDMDMKLRKLKFDDYIKTNHFKINFECNLKDKFEDEITDIVLRVFDLAQLYDIDLEYHIKLKMAYNKINLVTKLF